jgi:hypothetical protein
MTTQTKINEKSARDDLDQRIGSLSDGKAKFCLRALMLAGHVSEHTMKAAIELAGTVRDD